MRLCGHSSLSHGTTLEASSASTSTTTTGTSASLAPVAFAAGIVSSCSVVLLTLTKLLVESLFVLLHEGVDPVGELERESLDLGLLHCLEDDDLADGVERSLDLVLVDHARHDGRDCADRQGEGVREVREGEGSVVGGVCEKIGTETFDLDFARKDVSKLALMARQMGATHFESIVLMPSVSSMRFQIFADRSSSFERVQSPICKARAALMT